MCFSWIAFTSFTRRVLVFSQSMINRNRQSALVYYSRFPRKLAKETETAASNGRALPTLMRVYVLRFYYNSFLLLLVLNYKNLRVYFSI